MDCQDLLGTERVRTEILNVADSKRPAQDSVPVKDEGHNNGRANKQWKDESAVNTKRGTLGKRWGRVKSRKNEQWRKAPEWRGDNQGGLELVSSSCAAAEADNSSGATPATERRAV